MIASERYAQMIAAEKTWLILLAAGMAERFGRNKLREPFLGKPLAFHAVTALEDVPFSDRIVVKDGTDLDFESRGYRVIRNDQPETGMAHSIKLGVAAARDASADAVLIALADMPRITAAHIHRLLDLADSADAVVASSNGQHPSPPAVFGAGQFAALLALDGDEGARALVRAGRHVVTSPAELVDIDTLEDLEKLCARYAAPIRGAARRSD